MSAVVKRLKFKALAQLATWAMWKLWWDYKDDRAYEHVTRHVMAALVGGNEVGCEDGACKLIGPSDDYRLAVEDAIHLLRHIDSIDKVPGAAMGMPRFNVLWEAGTLLEREMV